MLQDSELKKTIEATPYSSGVSDPVKGVLDRAVCCPFCKELFSNSDDLTEHLWHSHAEQVVGLGLERIADHCVQEGSESLYICPYCRFAVGAGPLIFARQ